MKQTVNLLYKFTSSLRVRKKTWLSTKEWRPRATLKTGLQNLKKKCNGQWRKFARVQLRIALVCRLENLSICISPKLLFLEFRCCGLIDFRKPFLEAKKQINSLILIKSKKITTILWKSLLQCVWMIQLHLSLLEPRLKLSSLFKYTNVTNSKRFNCLLRLIRLKMKTTSIGSKILAATGKLKKLLLQSLSLMSNLFTSMSS